jgi:hypothetical protein
MKDSVANTLNSYRRSHQWLVLGNTPGWCCQDSRGFKWLGLKAVSQGRKGSVGGVTQVRQLSPRRRRIRKVRRVALTVALLCGIKVAFHGLELEKLEVNQLFSAMVASTVFLLGFLLSGVLTDFKESEKIPAEISTILETLFLEIRAVPAFNASANVGPSLGAVVNLGEAMIAWLQLRIDQATLLKAYWRTHASVVEAATMFKADSSTLKGRFLQELAVVLQKINRIQTIRDTTFVPLVYWMANIASFLLFTGLIFAKSSNLAESVFFLGVISFLVLLLIRLIEDIDNPFGWSDLDSAEDVSIEVLAGTVDRLRAAIRDPL